MNAAQHNTDCRFPYVLVVSMLGTVASFVAVWVAHLPVA